MTSINKDAFKDSLQHLNSFRNLTGAVEQLIGQSSIINKDLNQTILQQIPEFSQSGNPDVLPELSQHIEKQTADMLQLLDSGSISDFQFVHEYATRRAEQFFPLEAVLHSYRCSHKVYSRWLREAMLKIVTSKGEAPDVIAAVSDFTMEYTDAVSTIAAGTYVSHNRLMADIAGDQRAELLNLLLEGYDESDGRVAKTLRDAGYLDRRQSFCVILAQSVDPVEMLRPERARRLADYIDGVLNKIPGRRLVDLHNNKVTIIFSHARRASGWTAPTVALAQKLVPELLTVGNAARIGLSNDVPSTSQIPTAYGEAELAFEMSSVSQRVVQFSDIPLQKMLLHFAKENFQRILPEWGKSFLSANQKSDGVLVATLRAYANADMNVLKAAENLSVHPNTIYSRLEKIADISGRDARSYKSLTELLIVADCGYNKNFGKKTD